MPTFKKVQVVEKVTDVRVATAIAEAEIPTSVADDEVLLRVSSVGINATDINSFLGTYGGGVTPFDVGLEGLGTVVLAGAAVKNVAVGAHALFVGLGAFAEYRVVKAATLIPVPSLDAKFLTVPISLLTAAISIGELGRPKAGETALVTAAAGGTGQFAVQILKQKGLHVIATCSNDEKVEFLKKLGADRVINYKKESINAVLKAEYPNGVDVVYESVGGDVFEDCVKNVAKRARIIIIGSITGYKTQTAFQRAADAAPLQRTLLARSVSLCGFLLFDFADKFPVYLGEFLPQVIGGTLHCQIDAKPLRGIEAVADGIEHLHSGASFGKVVVCLD